MYAIALCDDETAELEKTENMLDIYQEEHPGQDIRINCFESADELLDMVREKNYAPDMILMDIYMPDKMGIEAAKELRSMGNEGKLIFLTTSRNYALEAFGVGAVQYLVKPITEKELFPVLDMFLKNIEKERKKYLLLRTDGRTRRVPVNEIVCCEAHGKAQCMHMSDGTQLLLRMTMTEIYGMLSPYQEFVRVGIAYIVNLEYIDSLNGQDICLNTGKKIYLPRGAYKPLKEQYFRYYCEE
ncbi:MAG TPA: DNA-binding response regulator [Lachnospiraceae bacterium]|nr:DNA-binding response regulator [Lachnospiraceae bacterium]